ncbi:DNA helicase RecQ [Adhaeretor mobilis]|uniref:DNA helicase RecQ n=1 Tax=Adhaeretor mobilis TaxID=1930276 RepID=A0A517MUP5_9BACT|nr:DNA helicase RecQ [Adhaeretor mobilis]QDS98615.1 ATP-dependent DNA helicase RecQ [Adhaeretor mobilis]
MAADDESMTAEDGTDLQSPDQESLRAALKKYWGYDQFRPLQREAMQFALEHRDSVVVLPTGGGKSLCYQAPALVLEGLTVVVSPLISLMKDQVDSLTDCGVPAACVHSMVGPDEKRQIAEDIRSGKLKLLYCSPERVVQQRTVEFLKSVQVSQVAVDEAHCISSWGHDFRPEYRQLRLLKDALPGVGMHAYTATATEQVCRDVAEQLGLEDAQMLVGSFDRPNLIYRVKRKHQALEQVRAVVEKHAGSAGIVYCISRKEVERTAAALAGWGCRVRAYHAGLDAEIRRQHQEEFASEAVDIIVATVAFGMGIDKSNVRYVVHLGMPKSLEQYQQESGRAGRDGLEAECLLIHSGGDAPLWRRIIADGEANGQEGALTALASMSAFCQSAICRHRAIVEHFGQQFDRENCGACDVCLAEVDLVEDATIIGQKIASCVIRLEQRYGADYTAKVLVGSNEQRILERGHETLSTYGLMEEHPLRAVRDWTEQLVGQGFLEKTGEYNTLSLTERGERLLRGELQPLLLKPAKSKRSVVRTTSENADDWEDVDRDLFAELRNLRRDLAQQRSVPAYIVFGDRTLRDMARRKPHTEDSLREVVGVGEKKLAEYGEAFLERIRQATLAE